MLLHLGHGHSTQSAAGKSGVEALHTGAYRNSDEVIDQALELLHEQNEWLLANRDNIDVNIRAGMAELDRGEGIPEDELDAYLERLKTQPK
jgi:Arc/MetJ-type ribon-helix-helix transcriptional regulator